MGKGTPSQKQLLNFKSYQQEWRHVLLTLVFKGYKQENYMQSKASVDPVSVRSCLKIKSTK